MSCATDFRKVSKRERKTDFGVTSDSEQVTVSCATEFRKVSERERNRFDVNLDCEPVTAYCAIEFRVVSKRDRQTLRSLSTVNR